MADGDVTNLQPAGPHLPGLSLTSAIKKGHKTEHGYIYFNHSNNRALRKGDWKIVAKGLDCPWELYDMKSDRCEQKDTPTEKPDVVKAMASQWQSLDELYAKQREIVAPSKAKRMPKSKTG